MPPMPLGLASVIAQLDDRRHEIRVLDLMFSNHPEADVKSALSSFSPDLIGISIRNVDNQCSLNMEYFLPEAKQLIQLCRSNSDATVVIGGSAFTVSPIAAFEYLEPDFGIVGEGELVFRELVERIERNIDWSDLSGLVWRTPQGITANPPKLIEDLDSLRPPRRDLFDSQHYFEQGGMANMVTKQGCPFRCLYCDGPQKMGPRWRMKSPERVADELESLEKDTGATVVFFTDAIFNHPPGYAEEVCQAISRRGLNLHWVAGLHPAFMNRKLIELMRDSGCGVISLGCESGSERMLKTLRKDFTREQLQKACELLEEMQISYVLSLLVGGPGEDRETLEETVDFLDKRAPLFLDMCIGIRLMPDTALREIAVQESVISADDPLLEPKFYISSHVKDWVADYLKDACSRHNNWTLGHLRS